MALNGEGVTIKDRDCPVCFRVVIGEIEMLIG